jgi:uncharacterized membrane protein HdeD (DUF308 family)
MVVHAPSHSSAIHDHANDDTKSSSRFWLVVAGAMMILLGLFAMAHPLVTTVALKLVLGWVFIIAGAVMLIDAFAANSWGSFILELAIAAIYLVAGIWLGFFPLTAVLTLTVLLGFVFIAQGIVQSVAAFGLRPVTGWFAVLLAGILSMSVGMLILAQFPSSAAWAIGLLVGINLIVSGVSYIGFGFASKGTEPAV